MEKVLALITESIATKNELCSQLNSLLYDYITVIGYATEDGINQPVSAGLVVFSSQEMYDIGQHLVAPGSPTIIAKRTLNLSHLDQLFSIPNGTDVLVVNDIPENVREVIHLLNEIGLDHLTYHPYAPGDKHDKAIHFALAPGEIDLIPDEIPIKIDIGARIIDISTIIEILIRLNLLDAKTQFITARSNETIIRLNKRLHQSNIDVALTNAHLTKVLNHMNDGIMAIDNQHRITVFNEMCETIFGIRSTIALGKPFTQIIRDPLLSRFLSDTSEDQEFIGRIGGNQYVIEKLSLDKHQALIVTFKDTSKSLDMEKKLRQMMMKKGLIAKYHMPDIIGSSGLMQSTIKTAMKLAVTKHNLLIYGESGVGKEIFAHAIHNQSEQAHGPFLAINFSALSEELAESELFGYEEGSFTGAKKGGKKGLFEEANGGTIFLDEIGDSSPRIQARLLRVLQEKEIRRIGGSELIPINVRVIAATNRNLNQLCQEGKFRLDLYHRLRKLYLTIPPLREHRDDLSELISHFLQQSGERALHFSPEVMAVLNDYHWPGNIRELENLIDYLLAVCDNHMVVLSDLPEADFVLDDYEQLRTIEENTLPSIITTNDQLFSLTEEDRQILLLVGQHTLCGLGIGREVLHAQLEQQKPSLTLHHIRSRIKRLADMELVDVRPGRVGMKLTAAGLKWFHQHFTDR